MAKIKSLLKSTQCWNATGDTTISGFTIEGAQPENSRRRFIFEVDNQLVKFDGNEVVNFNFPLNFQNVIQHGNTAEELAAVTSIPAWLGKKIFPIIAMDCPEDATTKPTAKISLKVNSINDIYAKDFFSPILRFQLTGIRAKIKSAEVNFTTTGAATCLCYVRIKNNDVWEDWTTIDAVKNKYGMAAQFKIRCIVSTFNGDDSVTIHGAKISYTTDDAIISGDTTELYTIPEDANYNLSACRAVLRHDKLQDVNISAEAIYFSDVTTRENISIGTGNGVLQSLTLPDNFVLQDTLKIFAGGVEVEDFFYNTQTSEIQVNAAVGVAITATYDCGKNELFRKTLTLDNTYPDGENFATRFINDDATDKKIAAIVYKIEKLRGSAVENLGTATGELQTFNLEHRALKESISCSGSWIYDEDKQILKVIQPEGENISVSYDFIGKSPVIFGYAAGWAAFLMRS